jgi:hypothetical protein
MPCRAVSKVRAPPQKLFVTPLKFVSCSPTHQKVQSSIPRGGVEDLWFHCSVVWRYTARDVAGDDGEFPRQDKPYSNVTLELVPGDEGYSQASRDRMSLPSIDLGVSSLICFSKQELGVFLINCEQYGGRLWH